MTVSGHAIDAPADPIPVLGAAGSPTGFICATGFSGHGFVMGPIVGRLMAELIVDGKPSIPLTGMEFSRLAEGRVGKPKSVGWRSCVQSGLTACLPAAW